VRIAACWILVHATGVESGAQEARCDFWPVVRRMLAPDALANVYELREVIRSFPADSGVIDPAGRMRRDLDRLDAIYTRAVELCEGDIRDALLACAAATLPYHRFPAVIPLTGIVVTVPVSTESVTDFQTRLAALPGRILRDSPPKGDRDKLPHFFGSAWLYLVTRNQSIVSLIAWSVEIGETLFKLEGAFDERDIAVSELGIRFAKRLLEENTSMPSRILHRGDE